MNKLKESSYDWSKIPVDLPKGNLVLITAKTINPTIHRSDPDYPVRIFNREELREAARSLAKRPMGLNHSNLIEGAFTVDAQWNESTNSIEALVFLPTPYINLIRRAETEGTPVKYSVEYTWRDENKTDEGVEFIGLCFDRVDLVYGMNAGDMATSGRLVETLELRRRLMEAEGTLIESDEEYEKRLEESADNFTKRLGEPFAGYKDFDACVQSAKAKGKSNPEAYCGYIKHQVEDKKKEGLVECQSCLKLHNVNMGIHSVEYKEVKENKQVPEQTNTMTTDVLPTPVEPPKQDTSSTISSIGAVESEVPVPVGEPDKSNQSVECKECDKSMDSEDKKLKESVEPPKEPNGVKEPDKPKEPEVVEKIVEKIVEKEVIKPDPADKARIVELEGAVTKLQENVKVSDTEKAKAVELARKEGKKEIISKIREVVPEDNYMSGSPRVLGQRQVYREVNKKLKESLKEE